MSELSFDNSEHIESSSCIRLLSHSLVQLSHELSDPPASSFACHTSRLWLYSFTDVVAISLARIPLVVTLNTAKLLLWYLFLRLWNLLLLLFYCLFFLFVCRRRFMLLMRHYFLSFLLNYLLVFWSYDRVLSHVGEIHGLGEFRK